MLNIYTVYIISILDCDYCIISIFNYSLLSLLAGVSDATQQIALLTVKLYEFLCYLLTGHLFANSPKQRF